jgi:hypothetical protein
MSPGASALGRRSDAADGRRHPRGCEAVSHFCSSAQTSPAVAAAHASSGECRHGDCVAALLAHGADPDLGDWRGRKPLSTDVVNLETLHGFRQRYHRHAVAPSDSSPPSEQARAWADELGRHGILKISGLVGAEALARMRAGIARFVAGLEARLARGAGEYRHYDEEEHYWVKDRATSATTPSSTPADCWRSPATASVEAARLYVGKQPHQRGVAMRYLNPDVNDMFGWHHDMEEKRLG